MFAHLLDVLKYFLKICAHVSALQRPEEGLDHFGVGVKSIWKLLMLMLGIELLSFVGAVYTLNY